MVFCMAETLRWSIGRELERQVTVLSSCVVSKSLYKTSLIIFALDNQSQAYAYVDTLV